MILDDLGARICIMGPSNSGKSTLATAIGRAKNLPVVHLDQLRHRPGAQWQLRPDDEFADLHDSSIREERWIIEGNYSALLPQRLARATGFILLDASAGRSLVRYVRRTLGTQDRVGGLEGVTDRLHPGMVRYILGTGRTNRRGYRKVFDDLDTPKVFLENRKALERFYRDERLER